MKPAGCEEVLRPDGANTGTRAAHSPVCQWADARASGVAAACRDGTRYLPFVFSQSRIVAISFS